MAVLYSNNTVPTLGGTEIPKHAIFRHESSANVTGTSGNNILTFNTLDNPYSLDVAMSSGNMQLGPGTWLLKPEAQAYRVTRSNIRIYNITSAAYESPFGRRCHSGPSDACGISLSNRLVVTIGVTTVFRMEVEHQTASDLTNMFQLTTTTDFTSVCNAYSCEVIKLAV